MSEITDENRKLVEKWTVDGNDIPPDCDPDDDDDKFPDDIEIDDIYCIIAAMRAAKNKYCEDSGIDGSFFVADITIYQTDSGYTQALRKIEDYETGFNRFWHCKE